MTSENSRTYRPAELLLRDLINALAIHQEADIRFPAAEAAKIIKHTAIALDVPGAHELPIPHPYGMPAEARDLMTSARGKVDAAIDRTEDLWRVHGIPEAHVALEALQIAAAALRPLHHQVPVPTAQKHPAHGHFRWTPRPDPAELVGPIEDDDDIEDQD